MTKKSAPKEPTGRKEVNKSRSEETPSCGFAEELPDAVVTIWSGLYNSGSCGHGGFWATRITHNGRTIEKYCISMGQDCDELLIEGAMIAFLRLRKPCHIELKCARSDFAKALIADRHPTSETAAWYHESFGWFAMNGWAELAAAAANHVLWWTFEPFGPEDELVAVARLAALEIDPGVESCPFC